MPIPKETEDRFFAGQRSSDVQFVINDTVRITGGPRAGTEAAVISITAIEPEVVYLVEPLTAPYGDVELPESALELVVEAQ